MVVLYPFLRFFVPVVLITLTSCGSVAWKFAASFGCLLCLSCRQLQHSRQPACHQAAENDSLLLFVELAVEACYL
jgi:hypothetical protein